MAPAKLRVTVTDLSAVQRVLTLLTGRSYVLTRFFLKIRRCWKANARPASRLNKRVW